MKIKVAMIVGSLRKESYNRKMAHALIKIAPDHMDLTLVEIDKLPMYNQDLEETPPKAWVEFRDLIRPVNGVLFLTPEYNRSVPAVLKNAVDVGSRPFGHSVWNAKAGAVISISPGKLGAFGANHHLRQSMVALNVSMMQQPEAYLGGAAEFFDASGQLVNEGIKEFAKTFIDAFAAWVSKSVANT